MATDPADLAFRRFLERATEDPAAEPGAPARPRASRPRHGPGRRPQRIVLVAAAVLLLAAGAVAVSRRSGGDVVSQPAGDPPAAAGQGRDGAGTAATNVAGAVPSTGSTAAPEIGVGRVPTTSSPVETSPTTAAEPGRTTTNATAASGPGAGASTTDPKPSPTPSTVLRLNLDSVPTGAPAGRSVVPQSGPALQVEVVGSGTIEAAPGGGRLFLPGGQQRTDYAVLTRVGPDVASLLPASGRIALTLVPQVDMGQRRVPTGRNIHTWFEIVSQDGPDHLVAGIQLNDDPEIGPYLSGAIQGANFLHVLTPPEIADLAPDRPTTVSLEWAGANGRVVVNGRSVAEITVPTSPVAWTPTARLSIGGSASWGGGYFASHQDALRSFEITTS